MLRHKVKAGITGWAQVNGWRGNTSLEKRIEYDLYYIENWSVTLDIKIMWLTARPRPLPRSVAMTAMPRTVVTGAAGFIGSHLCEALLDRGHSVVGIDNLLTGDLANIAHLRDRDFEFIRHDVTRYIDVDGPVDYVLHWASPASPIDYLELPIQTLKVGSLGTHNALGLAKAKGARFVIASTSEVYGDPLEHPQKETYWGNVNPIGPRGVYDEAKRFAEAMTLAYHRYHGVDTRIVRIFNTYGPRMRLRDGRAVPAFMSQALRNEDVTVFGDGTQTRSFCYVTDLVDGMLRLMDVGYQRPGEHRQPARGHDRGDRAHDHQARRLDEPDRLPPAAGGRSEAAATRHHPRADDARLGAEGRSRRGAAEDRRVLQDQDRRRDLARLTRPSWRLQLSVSHCWKLRACAKPRRGHLRLDAPAVGCTCRTALRPTGRPRRAACARRP